MSVFIVRPLLWLLCHRKFWMMKSMPRFHVWNLNTKINERAKSSETLKIHKGASFFPQMFSLKKIISWFQNHGIVGFVYSSKLKDRHMAYFTLQWKQNKDYFLRLLKSSPYIFCRKALQLVSSNTKKTFNTKLEWSKFIHQRVQ